MKIRIVIGCALAMALLLSSTSFAGIQVKPQAVETKAVKVRGSEQTDPNIRVRREKVQMNVKEVSPPPEKGGVKMRDEIDCWVEFDNWSGWYIDCYADGYYVGTVVPWGKFTANVGAGKTQLYGRATLRDLVWGPMVFNCSSDGHFNWKMSR